MSRFKWLIIMEDGEIVGTNTQEVAEQFMMVDTATVIELEHCYIVRMTSDRVTTTSTRINRMI